MKASPKFNCQPLQTSNSFRVPRTERSNTFMRVRTETTMTYFQESKENPMSCNSTNRKADPAVDSPAVAVSVFNEDDESQLARSSRRTFTNSEVTTARPRDSSSSSPPWNISSLLAILPDSPSPICSSSSNQLSPTSFYSQVSTEFSTPRNQSSCSLSNTSKLSTSSIEIDEWIENANDLPHSYEPNLQSKEEGMKCLSISTTVFESAVTEICSITLPSIDEEKSNRESMQSRCEVFDANAESPVDGRHKLMTRPKPYRQFLDEIKRQELEGQINARKNAKHMKYMDRLRRKEAAISDWELKQTRKAMNEMKKIESKLEKKRTKALEKTQKKISRVYKKAAEKKAREGSSTVNKILTIAKKSEKIRATKKIICLKLMRLC